MNQLEKLTYVVPSCQEVLLCQESGILGGTTKDLGEYENI